MQGSLTYRKILRHGASGFNFHPKEGVLRILIAGLNPRALGPVASTLCHRGRLYLEVAGRIYFISEIYLLNSQICICVCRVIC
jgi:hypothetical protein